MKMRNKLTLLFTVLAAVILIAFAASVYLSAYKSRESEFYKSLRKEAITKANLFFAAKVDPAVLQAIYKSNRETISEVEVAIYDTSFQLLYHDAIDIDFVKETEAMIDLIGQENSIYFYKDQWQVAGVPFEYKGANYIVVAAAFDQYGYKKLENLRNTILIGFLGSVLFMYLVGRIFSGKALSPVTGIIRKVNSITASNLDMRLSEANGKDEMAQLSATFNQMLDRLEGSFDAQKQFVSNISHELRTPIAALIAELELATSRERLPEEYQKIILDALGDAKKLARLSGSLLDFAKANYDSSEIAFRELRLDEVLLDARAEITRQNAGFHVNINYENEGYDADAISIMGNEYLLKVAFANLLDNGCKFSPDHGCQVHIEAANGAVLLHFADLGPGIPAGEAEKIFTPFFRGSNKSMAPGNGIGLPLAKRIVELHGGVLSVGPNHPSGTRFTVSIKHV